MGRMMIVPQKGKGRKMTPLMERFVDEYFVDFVATKAVLRAGYQVSESNANRMGAQLLRHPLVMAAIEKKKAQHSAKTEVTVQYVLQNLINLVEDTKTDEKYNPQATLRGLELIGKHLAMFRERTEISGPDGEAIKTEQRIQENLDDFTSRISRLAASGGKGEVLQFPKPGGTGGS